MLPLPSTRRIGAESAHVAHASYDPSQGGIPRRALRASLNRRRTSPLTPYHKFVMTFQPAVEVARDPMMPAYQSGPPRNTRMGHAAPAARL